MDEALAPAPIAPTRLDRGGPSPAPDPRLLPAQHALIHAQTAVLPLVFIVVIDRFAIDVDDIGLLLAVENILSGAVQLLCAPLSRVVTRRTVLGVGGLVYGVGMTALATATSWLPFSFFTIVARVGGSPQHPVGNAPIAEQRPVREHAGAIAAARAHGRTLQGFRALRGDHDLRWLFAASSIAAADRGIGVVSTLVPLYLARVLALDAGTVAVMYTLLLGGSVPGPILAGRLAGRYGHRRVLFGTYLLGAAALATLVIAGGSIPLVWLSIGFIGAFVYEESSLLQALLAEVAPTALRDVAFSAYFTLMFVVGAIWSAALGVLVGVLSDARGFPVAFGVMAVSYLAAILAVRSIRAGVRRPG